MNFQSWTFGYVDYDKSKNETFIPLVSVSNLSELKSFITDFMPKCVNGFDHNTDVIRLKEIRSKIEHINKSSKPLEKTIPPLVEEYNNMAIKWVFTKGDFHHAIYPKTRNEKGSVCNIVGINSFQDVIPTSINHSITNTTNNKRYLLHDIILGCVGNSLLDDAELSDSIIAIDFQKTICRTNVLKTILYEGWMIRLFTNRSSDVIESLQSNGIIRNPRRKSKSNNGYNVTSIYSK